MPLNKKKYLENIAFFKLLLNFKKQACFSNYPLDLLPAQSDFQAKNFFKKNFRPFSGLDGALSQQTVQFRNIFKRV